MQNNHQKVSTLPQEHDYLRGLLGDAVWLILSKIEAEQNSCQTKVIPRELVLKIKLLPKRSLLPVLIEETVSLGKAYEPEYAAVYSSGAYAMGTPLMYCDDPSEYWSKYASTNYLTNKI